MLGNLIGGMIIAVVGVTLLPVVANAVQGSLWFNTTTASNVTGASTSVVSLITLFFALGVMASGLAIAVQGLKNAGVM